MSRNFAAKWKSILVGGVSETSKLSEEGILGQPGDQSGWSKGLVGKLLGG